MADFGYFCLSFVSLQHVSGVRVGAYGSSRVHDDIPRPRFIGVSSPPSPLLPPPISDRGVASLIRHSPLPLQEWFPFWCVVQFVCYYIDFWLLWLGL